MKWEPDRNLQIRMALTLAFVLALPFGFAYVLLFLLNTVGVGLLETFTNEPWNGTFYVHPAVLAAGIFVCFAVQYAYGKQLALRSMRLYETHPKDHPDLHAAVTRLSANSTSPLPPSR
jgi:heat shock protein HtpX